MFPFLKKSRTVISEKYWQEEKPGNRNCLFFKNIVERENPSRHTHIHRFWRNQIPLKDKNRLMNLRSTHMNSILFMVGLCIALTAAALLFLNIIESGVAAMIGILGIGLIAASGRI